MSVGFQLSPKEYKAKDATQKKLANLGVESASLWVPMHLLPINRNVEFITHRNCSDRLHLEGLVIPSHQDVKLSEAEMIAKSIIEISSKRAISN